jgi:hypothetical protein
VTQANAHFYNLYLPSFTWILHVLALLSLYVQGDGTKTYYNGIGYNKHTHIVVSIVHNFTAKFYTTDATTRL